MKKVEMVSSGFDPIHVGHVRMIAAAAKLGDVIVIANSDEWLVRKKGYMFILENFRIIIETITCIFMCFLYSVTLFATISMIFIAIEDKDKEIEVLKIMALISFIDYIH